MDMRVPRTKGIAFRRALSSILSGRFDFSGSKVEPNALYRARGIREIDSTSCVQRSGLLGVRAHGQRIAGRVFGCTDKEKDGLCRTR